MAGNIDIAIGIGLIFPFNGAGGGALSLGSLILQEDFGQILTEAGLSLIQE